MATTDPMAHWRAQIFARLMQVVLLLGLITAIPSALLAASEGNWTIVAIDIGALLWLTLVWRSRGLAYHSRVWHFLSVILLVGTGLLLKVGAVSQIYLMAVPVLAAVLLGLRPALWALLVTGLTVLLAGHTSPVAPPTQTLLQSLVIALNFSFIAAIITLSCALLLDHLSEALQALGASSASLEQGQLALRAANAELRLTSAAVARLNDMVLIARNDPDQPATPRIIFVNDAFERRTGYRRAEVLGRDLRLLAGPDTAPATLERIAEAMARNQALRVELLNYSKDGSAYWVETELVPFADAGGTPSHWVAVERDITERKQSEDDIHRLAFFDMLTGLPNRRLLMDRLEQLRASCARSGQFSALMFIDLDHFKYINDARGHAVGDALLRKTAGRLTRLMRASDTVARLGGDEFVVLLANLGEHAAEAGQAALKVAEKIRTAIADCVDIEGQSYQCSASIGVTLLPKPGQSVDDLLREADTAMYRAKNNGRNGIAFFEARMQAEVEQRLTLERALAGALELGQLQMHLQAQVGRDGRVIGAELLMRWQRADGSMVAPDEFIPVAEESGLILPLGHFALVQACAAALALEAAGHPITLSVNVSPQQFRQPGFVAEVAELLASSGAPARLLILEVTEGLLIDKLDATIARMHELAALGLRFSIDDFGTGYSSLAYLNRMPLFELKIDRSFITTTPAQASSTAIVQTILAMARHLGLRVVAEGVETRAQADFLIASGCDCMQGFLYARAVPLATLLRQLEQEKKLGAAQ